MFKLRISNERLLHPSGLSTLEHTLTVLTSKDMFDPYRLLATVFPFRKAGKIHDGTASSFLNAMVNLDDNPDRDSTIAILSSFGGLDHKEQDKVLESPQVSVEHAIRNEESTTDAKTDD